MLYHVRGPGRMGGWQRWARQMLYAIFRFGDRMHFDVYLMEGRFNIAGDVSTLWNRAKSWNDERGQGEADADVSVLRWSRRDRRPDSHDDFA